MPPRTINVLAILLAAALASMPSGLRFVDLPLPYVERLDARPVADVDLVVIHCTELPDLATARAYGERVLYASGTGNSGHWYIDRDGTVYRYVPNERVAHHVRGHNERSVGVELVNMGRHPDWHHSERQRMDEPYTEAQIAALIALLEYLRAELPNLAYVAGHQDLDLERIVAIDDPKRTVARKLDPGPLFPWRRVLDAVPLRRLPL
jgi:N-acetylmuramoyl-L-alanine amidase